MATIIEQIESTVEPDVSPAKSGNEPAGKPGSQAFGRQKLAADLARVAARAARLRAD